CSNQFDEKCGLEENTIYKCTAGGKPEKVKTCDATKSCVSLDDGAACGPNDCKCTEDGISCGKIFPLSCKLKTSALYTCKKGQPPVFLKDCAPGQCSASKAQLAAAAIFQGSAMDKCLEECTCGGKGPACGSTFNPKCGLNPSTLYQCDGSGTKPIEGEVCGQGGCTVSNGDDRCNTNDCTCPGSGTSPVCGSELPSSCNAKANTIYICRGGSGSKPEVLSECLPGTQCIKKPTPEGAVCGSGTCDCKGENEVCSNQFPDECGLEKNTIYKCTSSGKPEKVKQCDATKSCVAIDDGAVCVSNDCKCPDDGTICGRVFPLSCKLKTTALYTCTKGGDPVLQKDCAPDRCSASKASFAAAAVFEAAATADVCVSSCSCPGKGPVCGSTFNPECNMKSSTLYKCDGTGTTPVESEVCGAGGCTVNNGDDNCKPEECTCPGSGTAPVCGSELPLSCGAKANTIYHCPGGSGTKPVPLSECKPGTQCIKKPLPEGAVCGSSKCDCKGDNEVCSNQFPVECGYEKNTIYKCTPEGTPEKVKQCDATESCVSLDGSTACVNSDCKCPDDGTVCGQVFPPSCRIKATALYTCKKGGDPVFDKDCYPDRCSDSKATYSASTAVFKAAAIADVCVGQCMCSEKGI
ncbi:hypothetical protein BGZ95_006989, partial [Linnemannia exigua]